MGRAETYKRELESLMSKLSKVVDERTYKILEAFATSLIAKGISPGRVVRYLYCLRNAYMMINKPIEDWGVEDLKKILAEIHLSNLSPHTKYEYQKSLRKFFKWFRGEKWEGYEILKGKKRIDKKPEILTEDEVLKIIDAATKTRDKAMIAVCYEAGLRVGELLELRIKDVEFNPKGAKIKVRGKTGKRKVLIIFSVPYLRRWLDEHPARDNPEAPLFPSLAPRNYLKKMTASMFNRLLKDSAKKAGIRKRVYPHILRHSRATVLASVMTEAQMCQYFGWVLGSDMPRIYVHLSGRDVDKAILKMYGLLEEEEETKTKPKKCPRCGELNPPNSRFCTRCALILDEKERIKMELEEPKIASELLSIIAQNPSMLEKLKEMIALVEKIRENPEYIKMLMQIKEQIS